MNLKITSLQMKSYTEKQKLPNLQELADALCEDEEIEYVALQSKTLAALNPITVGESSSIFTKIKKYPYEFEINSNLQLASIDGIKIGDIDTPSKIDVKIGDTILYKNNTFKVRRIIGNAITMVCIPDTNTPTVTIVGWRLFENCENYLNTACRDFL